MSRLPSPRIAVVAAILACVAAVLTFAVIQQPMTSLQVDPGPQRDVQGGADVRQPQLQPKVYDGEDLSKTITQPTQLKLTAATPKVFDMRSLVTKFPNRVTQEGVEREYNPYGEDEDADQPDSDQQSSDQPDSDQPDSDQPDSDQPDSDQPGSDSQLPASIDPDQFATSPSENDPAPAATTSFDGMHFTEDCNGTPCGAGHPPDTNGDVGPTYYVEVVNTAIGIYNKTTGTRVAGVDLNTFFSQGNYGNLCDTNNFGDPVVLYDSFEDRWFVSDFAFQLDGSSNVSPQHVYQCMAASKTGDPVNGGWNYYSMETVGGLGDYPKFGIWPNGIYWSANMFGYAAGASFQNPRVWGLNKAQMYAGSPTVDVVSFDAPSADFTLLPANARLEAGTPPTGTPEYFVSTWEFLNALDVYKLNVDWSNISSATFSGPFNPLAPTSWPNANVPNAPTPVTANSLDVLQIRAMAEAQYSNIGGAESLWVSHTVRRQNTTGFAAPRWYQVDVSGATVAANTTQAATWDPDAANINYRYLPSLAIDRNGDMAMGYSMSNSTTNPSIEYAGRLVTDPASTLGQSEQTLIAGAGTQSGSCGGSPCVRWGDYSGMALDPDGCTFWISNEYYTANGLDDHTRIGSFAYPSCTPLTDSGVLSGTVTASGSPVSGAIVSLGSRTATTNASGQYSFSALPGGTYPSLTAGAAGFDAQSISDLAVADSGTTTQNFALSAAAQSGSFVDTTQAHFESGVLSNVDITTSAGDVTLTSPDQINQQNTTLGTSGVGITVTTWGGQTFTPSITGQLSKIDVNLFCSGCTGTTPNLTLSIRATSGGLPAGADLASATVLGFNSGASGYYTANFSPSFTVTSGTQYAIVIRPTANPSPGVYALTRSGTSTAGSDVYAGGTRVAGATSGTVWSVPLTGGVSTDAGFRVYIHAGYFSPGVFTSSLKDANPAPGSDSEWGTLSWTATTPASTGVTFQVAASNSQYGPFSFVGPNNTTATTFDDGGSLAMFDTYRYLKYRATLTTSDTSQTPILSDVTIGFSDTPITNPTSLAVDPATGTYGGTSDLSATLTSGANPVPGQSVSFTLNGTGVGSATTDGSGIATLSGVSLSGINAGSYPTGASASFAGVTGLQSSSGSNSLTVDKATATLAFDAGSLSQTFDGNPKSVTVTTDPAGLDTVTITYDDGSGPTTAAPSAQGSYSVAASLDNPNYQATPISDTLVINAPASQDQTIDFAPLLDKSFGDADFDVSASASSGLTVTFGASGNCQMADADTVHLTGAGTCNITASQAGDGSYNPAPDVEHSFHIAKAGTTTSVSSNSNPSVYSQFITFTATVGSTAGTPTGSVQFKVDGHNLGAPVTLSGGMVTSPSTWSLTVRSHSVTAVYAATTDFAASTGSMSQTVTKANVIVTLTSSSNPAQNGTMVTFTVTVAPTPNATSGPSGKVRLLVNGHAIKTSKKLTHSAASWTFKWKLGTGTFDVTARYLGKPPFNAAVSAVLHQAITS